ncbi:MAG: hypothetical protein KatS3mg096_315 [Candidatus Parcubacteria bacterium]|nr:MAG: hypothetical protein KatS3mg096_315 [Candidatus Parcubacteria bacterium]
MRRFYNQILQAISIGKKNVWEIIDYCDLSLFEFVKNFPKNRIEKLFEKVKNNINLKKIKNIEDLSCNICQGTGYKIDKFFTQILKEYKKEVRNRPEALEIYDQGYINPEGVIRRIEFIYERGDLLNSRILIIGDDDLISIALGLTYLTKEIVVLEIDERLINFINDKARQLKLNVKAYRYNVENELPKNLQRKFDIFITDPVETLPGIKLFLSRGMTGLKDKGSSGYFGLTTLEASLKKWYQIERFLLDSGFVITDIKRKFNQYPGTTEAIEEKLPIRSIYNNKIKAEEWYKSSFIRIEAINKPKIFYKQKLILGENLYRDNESLATPIV